MRHLLMKLVAQAFLPVFFLLWIPNPAAAQTAKAASKAYSLRRMPDGHPDLQGAYDLATLTPVDRPNGANAVYTEEEARKLEAAAARQRERGDQALSAAGLLDLRIGGPSVKPPQPKGVAELSYAGSVKWVESGGADRYRRGLYIHFQRTTPYPQLMNFDAPNANLACTRRERTDTPLQALNLMNDPVFYESAQALAFRVMRESTGAFRDRLTCAFKVTLGREPNAREAERMGKYYDEALHNLQQAPQKVAALFPNRLEGVPQNEAAAWVELSRVLLNLDEFITRE